MGPLSSTANRATRLEQLVFKAMTAIGKSSKSSLRGSGFAVPHIYEATKQFWTSSKLHL